jgi:hypothetical protein
MSRAVIDKHPKRDEIINALLAGESLRKVSVIAGVSATAVQHYKNKILLPALEKAGKLAKLEKITQLSVSEGLDPKRIESLTKAVASVAEASIWHERQEKLASVGLETLEQARRAVRTTVDKDGNEVVLGQDFNPVWQGINALSRVQEIDGKARKILGDDGGLSIKADQMFLILPRIEVAEPESEQSAPGPVIDATLEK